MRIYLDYAATAPLRPEAHDAMLRAMDAFGNPSSIHAEGQRARALLDDARRDIAGCLGIRSERLVLTSGGTEAANTVIRGLWESLAKANKTLLVSAVEHHCVLDTCAYVGGEVIAVTRDGIVDMDALHNRLVRGDVGLVCLMHANNETGVIQPVTDVARLCHIHGALLYVDAVQTVGHLPITVDSLEADMLGFSGHKFGGPKGVGGLVLRPEIRLNALLTGGAQERNRRAGTENVPGICGMAAALRAACERMEAETATAEEIGARITGGATMGGFSLVAPTATKVPHILQLISPLRKAEDMVIAMDMRGVAVSQGSACSSGRVEPSHVLRAMGIDDEMAARCFRLSWGWGSTAAEAEQALEALSLVATQDRPPVTSKG